MPHGHKGVLVDGRNAPERPKTSPFRLDKEVPLKYLDRAF